MFHTNAISVRYKIDKIQTISNDTEIICITDSHLDVNLDNANLNIHKSIEMIGTDLGDVFLLW